MIPNDAREDILALFEGSHIVSEWYVFAESGDHVGPVTAELIARGILAGKVPRDARVARGAPAGWLDVRDAAEVIAALDDLSESTKTTQHQALSKDVPEPPATNRDLLDEATPGSEPDPTEVHRRDQIGIPKRETDSSKPPPAPRSSSKLPAAPASVRPSRAPIPAAGAPPAPPTQPLGTSGPPSGLALPNLAPKGSPPSKPRVSTSAPPPSAPLLSNASPAAPSPAPSIGLAPKAATLISSPPPAPPQAPPPSQIPAPISAAPPLSTQVTGPPPPVALAPPPVALAPASVAPAPPPVMAATAPLAAAPPSLAPSVPPAPAKEEKKDDKPKPPAVDPKMQLLVPLLSFGIFAVIAVFVAIYALVTKSYAR